MSNQPVQFEKAQKDDKKGKGQGEFNSSSFEVESEIKSVIEFEKINIKFQKMIEQTSLQTRKFWQEILKKNIDVEKVFGLGAKIYKNFVDIKKQYRHLMQLNNNYLEVAYLYKLFVSLILNFEIEVEDAKLEIVKIMQTKSMKKHNLKAEYKTIQLLEENGMIIISGSTGNFGKILAMNNKAERTFGYGTNELMAQKLHRLMPRLFADNHEDLILNFINGNRRINKENHQFVWGKHKSGFIIPLIMEINAYVNFEFNFCFIAFLKRSILLEFKPMRELLEYQDIFVMQVSSTGVIQDMTQNMQEYLNFPIQALNKDISAE
jgi:PAS domain S-box-containing protein